MEERATVVVASASEGVRAQLRLTLGEERFEVVETEATSGAAAEIAGRRPRVVVLDADLPGDGAHSLATSLRAQPQTEHVRILLLAPRERDVAELPDEVDATVGLPATSFALLRRIEDLLTDG